MILKAVNIPMRKVEYDPGQFVGFEVFAPRSGVDCLHDDHISAITASFLEQSARRRVRLEWRHYFDDVASNRHCG